MDKNIARDFLVKALDDMEAKALEMKIQGVGVACFLDKSSEIDWIGEMKVVETPYNLKEGWNLVAIAWSKAGEVIASSANSGNPDRKKNHGRIRLCWRCIFRNRKIQTCIRIQRRNFRRRFISSRIRNRKIYRIRRRKVVINYL
jgi:hypothetical protein